MREFIPFDSKRKLFAEKWTEVVYGEILIKLQMFNNIKIYKVDNDDEFREAFYLSLDENDARNHFYEINGANHFHPRDSMGVMMVSVNLN